jgi:hypothetical protein
LGLCITITVPAASNIHVHASLHNHITIKLIGVQHGLKTTLPDNYM